MLVNKNLALLFLFILIQLLFAQEKKIIAVLELSPAGVTDVESRILTDRLRSELFNSGKYIVLEREKMEDILQEQGFQQSGCTTNECVVEIGKLIGVSHMVAGNIGKLANMYTLSVRIIDVETGSVTQTATQDCQCPITSVLTKSIRRIKDQLSGISNNSDLIVEEKLTEKTGGDDYSITLDEDIKYARRLFVSGEIERAMNMLSEIILNAYEYHKIVQAIDAKIDLIKSSEPILRDDLNREYLYHRRRLIEDDYKTLISIAAKSSDLALSALTYEVMLKMAKYYISLQEDYLAFEILDNIIEKNYSDLIVQEALLIKIKFDTDNDEDDLYRLRTLYPTSNLIPEAEKIVESRNIMRYSK